MSIDVPGGLLARLHAPSRAGAGGYRPAQTPLTRPLDMLVFSHLRWDFVYQRPQHLMARAARDRRVFFIEEPIVHEPLVHATGHDTGHVTGHLTSHGGPPDEAPEPGPELRFTARREGATVVVPVLPDGVEGAARVRTLARLMDHLVHVTGLRDHVSWYYTPMALAYSRQLRPAAVVFDAMDELSAFRLPPAGLLELEAELLRRADIVFSGGRSLHEAKSARHPNAHLFPSTVDVPHFAQARHHTREPADQVAIPHPRLGYFGVVDERMDLDLIRGIAAARPEWQLVIVGPVVKIDPTELPQAPNIHWLGRRDYAELPAYLAGWDVALMPFAHNEATRFISPTKTPEYLAAGRPVVSTSIRDVVVPYGKLGLVHIADGVTRFVEAAETAMATDPVPWLHRVDTLLADISWDRTWREMDRLVAGVVPASSGAD